MATSHRPSGSITVYSDDEVPLLEELDRALHAVLRDIDESETVAVLEHAG